MQACKFFLLENLGENQPLTTRTVKEKVATWNLYKSADQVTTYSSSTEFQCGLKHNVKTPTLRKSQLGPILTESDCGLRSRVLSILPLLRPICLDFLHYSQLATFKIDLITINENDLTILHSHIYFESLNSAGSEYCYFTLHGPSCTISSASLSLAEQRSR